MKRTVAPIYLLPLLLFISLCTCDRAPETSAEGREGAESTQIDMREPREVAPVTRRPELSAVGGQEAVLELTPVLMNLLAKYELAADRALMDEYQGQLLERRANLRGVYNDFAQLGRRYDFPVHSEVPEELYASTAALEELRGSVFLTAFERAAEREREELLTMIRRYERRALPGDVERALGQLRTTLQ